jgi:hypothetical protein
MGAGEHSWPIGRPQAVTEQQTSGAFVHVPNHYSSLHLPATREVSSSGEPTTPHHTAHTSHSPSRHHGTSPTHPPTQFDPTAAEDHPVFLYHKAFLRPGAKPPPADAIPPIKVEGARRCGGRASPFLLDPCLTTASPLPLHTQRPPSTHNTKPHQNATATRHRNHLTRPHSPPAGARHAAPPPRGRALAAGARAARVRAPV